MGIPSLKMDALEETDEFPAATTPIRVNPTQIG
jgi:hypothetical protein